MFLEGPTMAAVTTLTSSTENHLEPLVAVAS